MANVLIDGLKERIEKAVKVNKSVGILLPGTNYSDLVQALFSQVENDETGIWVYVAVTRPYSTLSQEFGDLSELGNIKFIDCVSRAAGISETSPNCVYVESPTMLEQIGLEIINVFRDVKEDVNKYLVLDSLTNLIIYNDCDIVTEFFYHLINRTRANDVHMISLAIDEGDLNKRINRLIYLNDKILKVKESFI